MRIVCPACDAAYEVPGALLEGSPRPVRCARCANEWVPQAHPAPNLAERAAPEAAAEIEPPGSPARVRLGHRAPEGPPAPRVPVAPPPPADPMLAMFAPLVERPRRHGRWAALLAWIGSLLLVLLALLAAYVWRAEVQAAWPPIQRAYAAIGLR